jgi:pseudaminic acid cytidylyltransferase
MKICVIPARGGSKRIPNKNIRDFRGKPMITWAICHALESNIFDKIIASTDDERIAQIAREAGAETPFVRPSSLADDMTPTVPVIAHAVDTCELMGWDIEYVCCVYPCNPLMQAEDIKDALKLMQEKNAHFAYPVTEYVHPVQRSMRRMPSGKMEFLQPEHELTRTQDLEKCYHDAGQFYWGTANAWRSKMKMHTDGIGLVVPNWRIVDIDNDDDWKRAELLYDILEG